MVIIFVLPVAKQKSLCLHMSQLNSGVAVNGIITLLDEACCLIVTLDYPVVPIVSIAIVTEPRDLVFSGNWRSLLVRVEILASFNVLKPDDGSAFHWFTCFAKLTIISLF